MTWMERQEKTWRDLLAYRDQQLRAIHGVPIVHPEPPPDYSGKRKGGLARAASLTPDRRTEIARIAAQTRWGKA